MRAVVGHAERGGLVLGICNGFQILCEAGLLPGALMRNAGMRFLCKMQHLRVENAKTPFTRNYAQGQVVTFAIAHGEGNFEADAATLDAARGRGPGRLPLLRPRRRRQPRRQPQWRRTQHRGRVQRQVQRAWPHAAPGEPDRPARRRRRTGARSSPPSPPDAPQPRRRAWTCSQEIPNTFQIYFGQARVCHSASTLSGHYGPNQGKGVPSHGRRAGQIVFRGDRGARPQPIGVAHLEAVPRRRAENGQEARRGGDRGRPRRRSDEPRIGRARKRRHALPPRRHLGRMRRHAWRGDGRDRPPRTHLWDRREIAETRRRRPDQAHVAVRRPAEGVSGTRARARQAPPHNTPGCCAPSIDRVAPVT